MAVHVFSGTAIVLIVIQLPLWTPLITTPHSLRPSVFLLPSQNPLTAFHSLVISVNRDLSLPFSVQACQVVRLLIVLSENVLHVIVDQHQKKSHS